MDPDTLEGVLRDFDLSRLRNKNEDSVAQGTDRTGTVPFMALELLCRGYWEGKIERVYGHDLESFAWVIIYLGFTNDETLETLPAVDWYTSDYNECRQKKDAFLFRATTNVKNSAHMVYGKQQPWDLAMDLLDWLEAEQGNAARANRRALKSAQQGGTARAVVNKSREEMAEDQEREYKVLADLFVNSLQLQQAFDQWIKSPADDACKQLHQQREAKQQEARKQREAKKK